MFIYAAAKGISVWPERSFAEPVHFIDTVPRKKIPEDKKTPPEARGKKNQKVKEVPKARPQQKPKVVNPKVKPVKIVKPKIKPKG